MSEILFTDGSRIDGPDGPAMDNIAIGDRITIGGVRQCVPNIDRRWWQFWKPKIVVGKLVEFTVAEIIRR